MYKEELFYMYIVLDELKTFVHPCIYYMYVTLVSNYSYLLVYYAAAQSIQLKRTINALVSLAQSAQNTANIYYKIFMKRQL